MPTPIRMVPLDLVADYITSTQRDQAVLAIPVQGDGIWLEGVTIEDLIAVSESAVGDFTPFYNAVRKAAGA